MVMMLDGSLKLSPYSPIQPGQSSQFKGMTMENFPNVELALEPVFDSLPADAESIVSISYTHREVASHRSAVAIFAQKIIPALAAHGYCDLVLEIFPHGEPNDLIERELVAFNQTGIIGPEMRRFIRVLDEPNFELLLRRAHQYGIRIHSGGVDYDNIFYTIFNPRLAENPAALFAAREEIAENTGAVIRTLARAGKRVASFGGCAHTNPHPRRDGVSTSFGVSLAEDFPESFAAINLVIPELSARFNYHKDLDLPTNYRWQQAIPRSGVNLLSLENSHTIVLRKP